MLIRMLDHDALRLAQDALTGLSRRQEATASNIANIDTPGYRRRDVTFEEALRQRTEPGGQLARTDPRHIAQRGSAGAATDANGRPRDVVSARNDWNDVSIDEEMTLMVETQLRYQALSQGVGQRLSTLRTVIRGQ